MIGLHIARKRYRKAGCLLLIGLDTIRRAARHDQSPALRRQELQGLDQQVRSLRRFDAAQITEDERLSRRAGEARLWRSRW
ncbi:hypothetical protein D3C87_2023610 [compost metagenome]